ncbi:MAG: dTDP-glucose 4,6-dehydratase [Chloroflexi bacterium]|nr:MAG: dTDP-glucose 4,6-dehydratase [Chloroflexota bacterium]
MQHPSCARVVVTGGAGFIGSEFARVLVERGYRSVTVFDKLTYAGNPANIADLAAYPGFTFVQGDICDAARVDEVLADADIVVNFAAETHVDRSLLHPGEFIQTDVFGVWVLLEAARKFGLAKFVHVSTDEVYGEILSGSSVETDALSPRNPYSASKAGGEMMVLAYAATYGVPAVISRGSNTYGPRQYPEKFLPLATTNVLEGRPIPVYGNGRQMRDWMHVRDHAEGIELLVREGRAGEVYNVGGGNVRENLLIVEYILDELDAPRDLVTHVTDRQGHDIRYSLDTTKIRSLGWQPRIPFEDGVRETIRWYRDNRSWWEPLKSGEYEEYYRRNYAGRELVR